MASTTLPFRGTLPARRNQIGGCISACCSLPREGPFLVSVQQDPRPSDATRNSMLTSALLAVSSLRVTQQQGLFPHTTATTSGAAEASTPVAVMLVGAANDMNISDMQRLAEGNKPLNVSCCRGSQCRWSQPWLQATFNVFLLSSPA